MRPPSAHDGTANELPRPQPFLTEEVVAFVMELLIAGEIQRPVACRFVAPWVEGDLPASTRARTGAQTIHGLDIVRDDAGREVHPGVTADDLPFVVDANEMRRKCWQWLDARPADQGPGRAR
ncbi:hypothetical protein ACFSEO_13360 [Agromyces cerinus subsp. nitratus]|uniref:hypothetical protein n=1 Tax=Agromyces cerinus TaxID=33878 RepID=UPI00362A222A